MDPQTRFEPNSTPDTNTETSTALENTSMPSSGTDIEPINNHESTDAQVSSKNQPVNSMRVGILGKNGVITFTIIRAILVLGLLAALGYWSTRQSVNHSSFKIGSQAISLSDIVKDNSIALDSNHELIINGQLKVNGSVVLTPEDTPNNPTVGQMYLDKNSGKINYYNGSSYTTLAGTSDIQTPSAGVSSFQGQNGAVLLSAGNGINIAGTTISNTGVNSLGGINGNIGIGSGLSVNGSMLHSTISISSSSPSITITNDGNSNFSISESGNVALGPVNPQVDASTSPSISINKIVNGKFIDFTSNSIEKFVVDKNGSITTGTISYSQITGLPSNFVNTLGGISGDINIGQGLSLSSNTLNATGANASLSNLSNLSINTHILPGVVGLNIGSIGFPFNSLSLGASSNNSMVLSATATGTRNIILPDANGTICLQNSADCGFSVGAGSNTYIRNGITTQAAANLNIQSAGASNIGALIQGAIGQTANLQEWQNSSGTALASISSTGIGKFSNIGPIGANLQLLDSNGSIGLQVRTTDVNIPYRLIASAGSTFAFNAQGESVLQAMTASQKPLTIQGFASQTANLQNWTDSLGSVLANINATGAGTFAGITTTGLRVAYSEKTTPYQITVQDHFVSAGGPTTTTLPTAVGIAGQTFTVVNEPITPASYTTIATVPTTVAGRPWVNSAGTYVYVGTFTGSTVRKIRTSDNTVVANITTGTTPRDVASNPSQTFAYSANTGSNTVSVIRLSDDTVSATITVGASPSRISITPDGAYAYVTNSGANTVSKIRLSDNTVVSTITIGASPGTIAINSAGTFAYITYTGNVAVLRLSDDVAIANIAVGTSPGGIVINSAQTHAYVSNYSAAGIIWDIRLSDNTATQLISGVSGTSDMDITPDGAFLLANRWNNSKLTVIRISDGTIVANVTMTNVGSGIRVNPAGTLAYAVNEGGTIQVIQLSSTFFGPITIARTSGQAIDGVASNVILPGKGQMTFLSDGANWIITNGQYADQSSGNNRLFNWSSQSAGWVPTATLGVNTFAGSQTIIPTSAGNVGAIIQGYNAQTSNLQEWQNSAGTQLMVVNSGGNVGIGTNTIGTNNRLTINPFSTIDNQATAIISTNAVSNKGLVIQGYAGQTANLQEWQNSAGTTLATVSSAGTATFAGLKLAYADKSTPYQLTVQDHFIHTLGGLTATLPTAVGIAGQTFTVVDENTTPPTDTVTNTISGFNSPNRIAMTPNGLYAYVTNSTASNVKVIRISDNTIVATIAVGTTPTCIAVTPDGSYVYVCNQSSSNVSVIRTSDNSVTATINVTYAPYDISIAPDGSNAYVAIDNPSSVKVIRLSDNTVTATVVGFSRPRGVAVAPNGAYAYVSNYNGTYISILRTSDNTVTSTVGVGSGPIAMAFTPDGAYAYVANYTAGTVSRIRTSDNIVTNTITVGTQPNGVTITPDGSTVYVTNSGTNNISRIRTSDNTITDTISVGTGPSGINTTADGATLYVSNSGSNNVMRIARALAQFGPVTISRTAGQTIDGLASDVTLNGKGQMTFLSDGANWLVTSGQTSSSGNTIKTWDSTAATWQSNATLASTNIFTANQSIVGSTDSVQLKVKSNSTQTANLQEWQNSSGTILTRIDAAGTLYGGVASFGNNLNASAASAATIPFKVNGVTSQTANLTDWRDVNTNVLASISATGLGAFTGLTASGSNVNLNNNSNYNVNINTGTSTGTLTVGGNSVVLKNTTNSTTAFDLQNSSGSSLMIADTTNMKVTVANLVVTSNLTVNGHIVTGGTTPAFTAGAAACTTPTVSINGNDTSGSITITTGTGCSATGVLGTITFTTAFGAAPRVNLTPTNSDATNLKYFKGSGSTASFTLDTATIPANSTTYTYDYWTAQ